MARLSEGEQEALVSAVFEDEGVDQKTVLDSAKMEVDRFEKVVEMIEPIEKLLIRREDLRSKRDEFRAESSDPQRLLVRTRTDPGKLLREEKLRKEIAGLPKLETKIRARCVATGKENRPAVTETWLFPLVCPFSTDGHRDGVLQVE